MMRICQIVALSVALLSYSSVGVSQEQNVSPDITATTPTYANTSEGLKQLLQDMRTAAIDGNEDKLAAFVKDTEIPNCDVWLHKMYDSDNADSKMALCEAKFRDPRERGMKELFVHIAKQDGKIITRKVNDDPSGDSFERGWLEAIKQPLDIYWASWLPTTESDESEADPIGYFMFIDGAFRWRSTLDSLKPSQTKISHAKVVQPKLIKKVAPIYPAEAAARNASGTIHVYYVIGADGLVYNAHAISGQGFSDDPALRKAAEEAVLQWRFEPATFDGTPAQMTMTTDIVFSPH
jgi:TonB family protein